MPTYMRNKANGEIREVEVDTSEFRDLQREVTSTGLPMWEQTSIPHGEAIKDRAKSGELLEEDLGHDAQNELRYAALQLDAEGVAPERNPHLALSPAEIESGQTPQQKLEDLRQQFNERVLGKRAAVFDEAADRLSDGEREEGDRPGLAGQTSARSGGSDDRDDAPARGSQAGSGSKSPSSGQPAGAGPPGGTQGGDQ